MLSKRDFASNRGAETNNGFIHKFSFFLLQGESELEFRDYIKTDYLQERSSETNLFQIKNAKRFALGVLFVHYR